MGFGRATPLLPLLQAPSLLLLGGLGHLGAGRILLLDSLDDTDSHRLPHVAHGEATQGRVLSESLHTHGLGGNHLHEAGVTVLDELRLLLELLAGTTVDLGQDLRELDGNVGGVAVQHGRIPVADLAGVVHDDDLR